MTDQTSFASILDRPLDAIERPKAIPSGTYLTIVKGMPKQDVSSQKKTPYVEFTHKFVQATDDVDQEALAAALTGSDGSQRSLTDIEMRNTYYLTDGALWRLKEFLETCGLEVSGRKISEVIDETPNREVFVTIRHEPSADGKVIFAKIGGTLLVS